MRWFQVFEFGRAWFHGSAMIHGRRKKSSRLRAASGAIALLLGWLSVSVIPAIGTTSNCPMSCCAGICHCCRAKHNVPQQASDDHERRIQDSVGPVHCPPGCPAARSSIQLPDSDRPSFFELRAGYSSLIDPQRTHVHHISIWVPGSSSRAPPFNPQDFLA